DKAMADLEGAIQDLRDILSPAAKLQVGVDYHGEVRTDETTQNFFNLRFQTRPDRYYLVGLTEWDATVRDETHEELQVDDANATRTRTTITEEYRIRFNLQLAKRWYFAALRFGLFESTGGLASDFYLFRDHLKLSLEAFNWRTKNNPLRRVAHLKAYATVNF